MSAQISKASKGIISDEVYLVAKEENVDPELIRQKIEFGQIVILKNNLRESVIPKGIGGDLRVKISADIFPSKNFSISDKQDAARATEQSGADIIVDLNQDFFDESRRALISSSKLPLGTIPILQSAKENIASIDDAGLLTKKILFSDVEKHLADGADFVNIQCGISKSSLENFKNNQRLIPNLPYAASIIASYIEKTSKENPYFEYFDELLKILKHYDAVLFLEAAFSPCALYDSFDRIQIMEFTILSMLQKKALKKGVQTVIKGIGHVPLDKIEALIKSVKHITNSAPLMLDNCLACDCAFGYENISGAIASSLALYFGANLINASYPSGKDAYFSSSNTNKGLICAKIAAQCAESALKKFYALSRDNKSALANSEGNTQEQMNNAVDKSFFAKHLKNKIDVNKKF